MLFEPYQVAGLQLKNRIVHSALTRLRAELDSGNPTAIMKQYYEQRTGSAGLIVSDALSVSPSSSKFMKAPGMFTQVHAELWKQITTTVHSHSSYIFAQLAHYGRLVHPDLAHGKIPISSSEGRVSGKTATHDGDKDFVSARPMRDEDFQEVVGDFASAAQYAKLAGFDGVELHAAHGLLIAQFLNTSINKRTDRYGGSVENRARFLLEIVDAVLAVWSPDRVIVKISFVGRYWEEYNDNPLETMEYVLRELNSRNIQFVALPESDPRVQENNGSLQIANVAKEARKYFKNTIITNGFRPIEERIRKLEESEADLVAFGEQFIANPDLAHRLQHHLPLSIGDPATYFAGDAKGYIDYPNYDGPKIGLSKEITEQQN